MIELIKQLFDVDVVIDYVDTESYCTWEGTIVISAFQNHSLAREWGLTELEVQLIMALHEIGHLKDPDCSWEENLSAEEILRMEVTAWNIAEGIFLTLVSNQKLTNVRKEAFCLLREVALATYQADL